MSSTNIPEYRVEDQFRAAANAAKLKELYSSADYAGLLEMALLLNHEASFNASKLHWMTREALLNMNRTHFNFPAD